MAQPYKRTDGGEYRSVLGPDLVSTFDGWEAMLEVEDADITVDEAHLYAPSWDSKALPAPARWYLSHLRKLGVNLTWVKSHEDRTAKTLRDLTNEVVVHQVFYFGSVWFIGNHYEPGKRAQKEQTDVADLSALSDGGGLDL